MVLLFAGPALWSTAESAHQRTRVLKLGRKCLSKRGPLCVTRRASSSLLDALLRSGLAASSEGLPGRARCARQLRSSEQARTCPTSGRFRWMAEPRVLTVYAFVLKWQS